MMISPYTFCELDENDSTEDLKIIKVGLIQAI